MKQLAKVIGSFICFLLVLSPLALCQMKAGSEPAQAAAVARGAIWKEITSGHAGSATVAITDSGRTVYAEGFGMADREQSIPVERDTLFNIGSVSKVYCAMAVMLLVDEGKVELDQPVTAYLPGFTMEDMRYKDITVRMLLNHSSGLPGTNYVNSYGFAYNDNFYQETLGILAQSQLKHKPGEMAVYCNDGFTLAEMIVAKLSGRSYREFLEERIFKPLALQKTDLAVGQRDTRGLTVARYYNGEGVSEPLEVLSFWASGGLSTSAEELCRFVDVFSAEGTQLLSQSSLGEMQKKQPAQFWGKLRHPQMSFGLGWDMAEIPDYENKGIHVLGKSGGTGHYTSMVYTVPDKRISVAVITTGNSSAMEIARKILDAYLVEKGLMKEEVAKVKVPVKAQALPDTYQEYAGFYVGSEGVLYKVDLDIPKGKLIAYSLENGGKKEILAAAYGNSYFHTADDSAYYFATVDGSRYFISCGRVDAVLWQKIEPLKASERAVLAVDVDGQQWLRRNVKAYEGPLYASTHVVTSRQIEKLPGYVDFMGLKPVRSPLYAGLPGKAVRDATELKLNESRKAELWLSGGLYRNAKEAAKAQAGKNKIVLGAQGYNEWLVLPQAAVLHFAKPSQGRIIVFSPSGSILYDSIVKQGDIFAPAGSFAELLGEPGDVFELGVSLVKQ